MKLQPLLILSFCFSSMLIAVSRGVEPITIGSQRQLFLDDFIIERIDGLKRVMHQPDKKGAVFLPRVRSEGPCLLRILDDPQTRVG